MTSLVLVLCLNGVAQPPGAELPPPAPQPLIAPPPAPQPLIAPPPTLKDFARTFKPQAGVFDVTVVHPVSGKPVNLVFKLPDGCPKVNCGRRSIEFCYGNCDVEIVFRIGGRVGVEYRN